MAEAYFAYGATLSALVNLETLVELPPHVLPDGTAGMVGGIETRMMSGRLRLDGKLAGRLQWDMLPRAQFNRMIAALFGTFANAGTQWYWTLIDEAGGYSPFRAWADLPRPGVHYQNVNADWVRELTLPLYDLELQSVTRTALATTTAAERLTYGDTTAGGFTLTLPLANTVQADTVVSFEKRAAANVLTLARQGTNLINGVTSATLSALYERIDLASNGVDAWRTVRV